ncbi:MAG: glutathione S-transferase [Gammaproteobacteria bacterium]|jgi:glutathione S-transferase
MKPYWVDVAPNPTKVRVYIAKKLDGGAAFEIKEVRVKLMKGEQNLPENLQRNPFATAPVSEIAPSDYIIESLCMMDYLEACFLTRNRLRDSIHERAKTRQMERLANLRVVSL